MTIDMALQESELQIPFAEQRLVSVSLPCKDVDPMQMLRRSSGRERFYWRDPRTKVTYVGMGIAADFSAWGTKRFESIADQASALFAEAIFSEAIPEFATPHLFGGFSFSEDFTPDNTWSIYHPAQFVLPHYQLAIDEELQQGWMTINTLIEVQEATAESDRELVALQSQLQSALEEWIAQLAQPEDDRGDQDTELVSQSYPMTFADWQRLIEQAVAQFQGGDLQKVVLSRVCELRFRQTVQADRALKFLNENYPDCFRFLFEPRPFHAFFGASPELLVDLHDRRIATMGLAGSEPRGKTSLEDEMLGNQLLNSPKDRHEHQLVVDALRQRLSPICTQLSIPDQPQLLKLRNIQHLYTPIDGTLLEAHNILRLLEILHPTPALGGSPRELALRFISEHEPAPRGWYAAPIGILDRNLEGTFSVAIRSAVTEYERVWLHAGAGIVSASNPQKEWDETALKFRPILNALNVSR